MDQEMKSLHVEYKGSFEYDAPFCYGDAEGLLDVNVPSDVTDADLKEIIYEAIGQRHGIAFYDICWSHVDTAKGDTCLLTATRNESRNNWVIVVESDK